MKNANSFLFLLFALFLLPFSSQAQTKPAPSHQTINPDWFAGMKYRSVGPSRGGRATAAAGIPDQPFTFFMGATGGGVWKTTDAGTSWKNVSDGQIEAGSIGAIAVAPSDPMTIYVGTGSACPRGNVSAGIGMYKSNDGGKNWHFIGLPKAGQIGKIIVHPTNPDWLYVAALGSVFGENAERGVYRSKDGGESWYLAHHVSKATGAIDMTMNPNNPREIYAAMWAAERKPWTLKDGNKEGGIWKTVDGGDKWTKLEGGLPDGLLGRIGLAISPAQPDRIWAIIMAKEEEDGGVYRSDDSGETWKRISRDHNLRQRGWYYSHIIADPVDKNTVYVNNVGFWKSIDGGKNFDIRIRVPHGDTHGLWINPNNTAIMINVNDGGACVSLNGGATWSSQLNQPTSEFYRLTIDDQFPYRLYAGQQDNSTISVPSHSSGSLTPYQEWYSVGGSECGDVGIHPNNPEIAWAGSYSGELTITDLNTGHQREVTAYPHYTEGTEQRDLKYRWQWNFPIVLSKHEPGVVYHTSNYVHRSKDNGQNWETISKDLTGNMNEYHDIPGGPIQHDATGVEVYSSIFAFEESALTAGEFWAGSDDGLVHLSRDGGKTWQNITPKDMIKEGTVNKIELSPHGKGRAFLAVYNYRYNDFKPYIYRTNDYGKSWEMLSQQNGIPEQHFVRSIAEDPQQKGLLYAGTEYGVYVSFDDGENWQAFQLNLPHVPITDMEVVNNDLVLSTQGRAFWILDDLTPLHQLEQNVVMKKKHLFKPRAAYRTNISGMGARFHFQLQEEPDEKAEANLEVLDSKGKVVSQYTTDAKNKLKKLKIKKGFNTFSWNLRHTGPELVSDLVTMVLRNPSPGPWAVPGDYTVRLTIGDWSESQPFSLLADPRWTNVRQEDYQAQLELSLEVSQLITEAHQRIKNIRAIRKQVEMTTDLAAKAGHKSVLDDSSKALHEQLNGLEARLINKAEASQDNINYRRVFSNHIGRLYQVLTGSHHRPTGGVLERYEDLKVEYAGIVRDYDAMMNKGLADFKNSVEKAGIERFILPEKF